MWRWPWDRREAIGEPPPEITVTPEHITAGDEVHLSIEGPPGGVLELDFELQHFPPIGLAPPPPAISPAPVPLPPRAAPPVPPPGAPSPTTTRRVTVPAVSRATSSALALPDLADQIANIIAYAIVFYGMVAGAMAANFKWGFLVTLAMMAMVWYLRDIIVAPLQGLIKSVVLVVFHVLIEILDFVWEWLRGVANFFGGDLVRAVFQILMVASFLWVWEQATQIPVIGQLLTFVQNTATSVMEWVQTNLEGLRTWFDGLRKGLEGDIRNLTKDFGDYKDTVTELLTAQVDTVFGRIQTSLTGMRAEVLGRLSSVVALQNLQVASLAAFVGGSAPRARQYLVAYNRAHPHETVAESAGVWAAAGRGQITGDDLVATPWDALAEIQTDLAGVRRGVAHEAHDILTDLMVDIATLRAGGAPDVPTVGYDELYKDYPRDPPHPPDDGSEPAPADPVPDPVQGVIA